MTQKQILGVVVGVAVILLLGVVVYKQFAMSPKQQDEMSTTKNIMPVEKKPIEKKIVVPDTIDSITGTISAESDTDAAALDDEAAGEKAEMDADSESVNNLENSYDTNNL